MIENSNRNILMVALNEEFIRSIEEERRDYTFYVLEEPDIMEHKKEFRSPRVKEIIPCKYQQNDHFLKKINDLQSRVKIDAVLPGLEYGVIAASKIAAKLKLPFAGDKATKAFTNKLNLREQCSTFSINQPRFKRVNSVKHIDEFYNGKSIILKPANRRGSVGVVRIDSESEIESAWNQSINASEGIHSVTRKLNWTYLVEEYIDGYEVSLETLVYDGKILFSNVTYKEVLEGKYPVEKCHIVPAPINETEMGLVKREKEKLVNGLEVSYALLHSEWKVNNQGAFLIECAARAPGDNISKLISLSYNFNLFSAFVDISLGEQPKVNQVSRTLITNYFLDSSPGKLLEIIGLEFIEESDFILSYRIKPSVGDYISPITNSMSRPGSCIFKSSDIDDLKKNIREINQNIKFIVE